MKAADRAFADELGRDETSGATEIVSRTARFLAAGNRDRQALVEAAEACAEAQPAMAGLVTIVKLARDTAEPGVALRQLLERLARVPTTIARYAAGLLRLGVESRGAGPARLTLVTCSASAPVGETLLQLAGEVELTVCCAESRPRCEGASLARRLAAAGLEVRLFTDAGISAVVPRSDALVIGADAVGPDAFVNKVGTGALCALASTSGVPVYVLAGREKLLGADDFERIRLPERLVEDAVASRIPTLRLENPTFERVPRHLVSQLITDAGVMT